ncbi:hypothetical protein AAFH68_20300 [Flavobacterium sp. CGRL1]
MTNIIEQTWSYGVFLHFNFTQRIMSELKDISTLEDIKQMVDSFYANVRKDDLIGPIFNDKLQDRWEPHLQKMYGFWQTILFDVRAYSGTPFRRTNNCLLTKRILTAGLPFLILQSTLSLQA